MALGWNPNKDTWNLTWLGAVFLATGHSLDLSSTSNGHAWTTAQMFCAMTWNCSGSQSRAKISSVTQRQASEKEPKTFKQEGKPQLSSISCAPVKTWCPPVALCALTEVPEPERKVKTDEYKNKKISCYFQASILIQCWWTEPLKIMGSLC